MRNLKKENILGDHEIQKSLQIETLKQYGVKMKKIELDK